MLIYGLEVKVQVKLFFNYIIKNARNSHRNNCSRGAILIFFALIIPVILLIAGMISDIGRAFAFKAELNRACMVASEEATKEIDMITAQNSGKNKLRAEFHEIIQHYFYENIAQKDNFSVSELNCDINGSGENPKYVSVSCRARLNCFFLKFIGINYIEINSSGNGRLKGFLP